MSKQKQSSTYHSTESKYKGGAQEMYVTYDLEQNTSHNKTAMYPKVKRVYVPGEVTHWEVGTFQKRSGRRSYGVKVDYEKTREAYHRSGYTARRQDTDTEYHVPPTEVPKSTSHFSKIVEVPRGAENIKFHKKHPPAKYQNALQSVR